ncbi:tyrosine-type recombinase/integrase [Butyrivibrio sp. AE2032]|uniref:tyrosine-type recombinase/integrase n=1 Tax=Butyrivibrio sp. AE2032 TaxID=1458463 RepID=UPI000A9963B5|nr:tyrosine-type recombinase/integrase [Butyrivibrio sp. AE2032]
MMDEQILEFTQYLQSIKNTSENTVLSYKRDLMRMMAFMEERGIRDVRDITEDRLLDYAASLREEQFAPSSITRHNTSIKAFFRYMLENGNIEENPAEKLKSPKIEKTEPRVLSTVEIENLLSQRFTDDAKGKRDKAILELMYATGLKTSEMISLKLSNIDLSIGCIRLKGTAKNGKDRLIPYGKKAKEALSAYLLDARAQLLDGAEDDETVFLNCSGVPMSRQGLWKLIKTYVKKAGVKSDITPFTLRHSFAVHLVDNGADVSSVQELMGYSDSNTISRYIKKRDKVKDPYQWARVRN